MVFGYQQEILSSQDCFADGILRFNQWLFRNFIIISGVRCLYTCRDNRRKSVNFGGMHICFFFIKEEKMQILYKLAAVISGIGLYFYEFNCLCQYACYKQSLKSVFRVFDSRFLCSGIISLIIVKSRNILNYLIFAVTR